jgi:CrcB protein
MKQLIAIALGGAAGAVARFLVANGIHAALGRGFPHGTLFVNVSGSLLMGFLTESMLQRFALASEYRAAILVGFLGAYTTFSTFALETFYLFEQGGLLKAFLNIFLSTVLCLVAVWLGLVWARMLFAGEAYAWPYRGTPYLGVAWGMFAAFWLVIVAEFLFKYLGCSPEKRAVTLVLGLGVLTIASTLWLVLQLTEIRPEPSGLLSLFALNGLFGAGVIWLGVWVGNWLLPFSPAR